MTWHRIDDPEHPAPRDGNWVLGWAPGWLPVTMAWVNIPQCGTRGWYVQPDKLIEPTHWMPLPEPPPQPEDGK